ACRDEAAQCVDLLAATLRGLRELLLELLEPGRLLALLFQRGPAFCVAASARLLVGIELLGERVELPLELGDLGADRLAQGGVSLFGRDGASAQIQRTLAELVRLARALRELGRSARQRSRRS